METTIYIAKHQSFHPPKSTLYSPIVAGADFYSLPYLQDNVGEHISYKNPYYSELTAWYWVWKHSGSAIVGFTHYHRYFFHKHFITEKEIYSLLRKYEIILPEPEHLSRTVYEQYAFCHYKKDLKLACSEILRRDILYRPYIEEVLNQNYLYTGNMCIASKEVMDAYFSFLFPLLFSLEKQIPYFQYPEYQKRVFGFLAERIFSIYIARKQLYVKEYSLIDTFFETPILRKMKDCTRIKH